MSRRNYVQLCDTIDAFVVAAAPMPVPEGGEVAREGSTCEPFNVPFAAAENGCGGGQCVVGRLPGETIVSATFAPVSSADELQSSLVGLSDDDVVATLFASYFDWYMGHPGGISSDFLLSLQLSASQRQGLLEAMDDLHAVLNPDVAAGGSGAKPPRRPKVT